MGNRQKRIQQSIVNPDHFGVTFSLKQCRNFGISQRETLQFLLQDMGFRRFRLMSYWNEHEKSPGIYDFTELDAQIKQIENAGGVITLCLGVRQPRWPESHWPKWALGLSETKRYDALYNYIKAVVNRYKDHTCIISWQLENEALNRSFGVSGNFDRRRLRTEFNLVRKLDSTRPIIMSTSNTWGIPIRRPRPDMFGFTLYQTQFESGSYHHSRMPSWWPSIRAKIIRLLTGKSSFIHELQAEPWGPKAIWEMPIEEQDKSMNTRQLRKNIQLTKQTNLYPIDLWGGEWWYWRKTKLGDPAISNTVKKYLHKS